MRNPPTGPPLTPPPARSNPYYRQVSDENTSVWRSHLLTPELEIKPGLWKADRKPVVGGAPSAALSSPQQPLIKALSYISILWSDPKKVFFQPSLLFGLGHGSLAR